jgi:ABC-2 type transport system permease protein
VTTTGPARQGAAEGAAPPSAVVEPEGAGLGAVRAQSRIELVKTLRQGEGMLVNVAVPVGVLVLFAKSDLVDLTWEHPVDFLFPGVLALAVMSSAMVSLGIATGFERRYGVLKRLGTTPLTRGGLLAAKTIGVLLIEVLQTVVLLAAALALGWDLRWELLPAIALMLVGTVIFAAIGLLMAGTLRAEANLAAANALYLVLLTLGGMAYPLDDMPAVLEPIAKALPSAALAESLRALLTDEVAFEAWTLVVLGVWLVAAPLAASRLFRWEE